MLTLLLYLLLALVVVAALFGLAVWLLPRGGDLAPAARDERPWELSENSLHPDDIAQLRLPVAIRGYRFHETDVLLDRLADELRARDAEIVSLQDKLAEASTQHDDDAR